MKNLLILSCLFIGISLQGQTWKAKADEMIEGQYTSMGPGAAVLVAQGDEVVYTKSVGKANIELDIATNKEHVFCIGSITKQMTATCIMQLREKQLLELDDPLTKFFPNYPVGDHVVTIHHLLTHTSGIQSYTEMPTWFEQRRKDYTPKEFIDFFKDEPFVFAPGERYVYNNSAYYLLGLIIEQVSGDSYEDYLKKNIFIPAGMLNSQLGSHSDLITNRASGYTFKSGVKNADTYSLSQTYSAGAVFSTVEDMFKWNQAIKENLLVSEASKQLMHTDYTLNNGEKIGYGYGWAVSQVNGVEALTHSGGIFGYTCNGIYVPDEDTYLIMLTNSDALSPAELSNKLAALVIGKPFPEAADAIELPVATLEKYEGVYLFPDSVKRVIYLDENQLISRREDGRPYNLYAMAENRFFFEGTGSTITFEGDKAAFNNAIRTEYGTKTGEKAGPKPAKVAIEVDSLLLPKYVGVYELVPGFNLTIDLQDNQLYAQATGQMRFPIYPMSETRFFLKVVDADVEFKEVKNGQAQALVLYQAGREMPGKRLTD